MEQAYEGYQRHADAQALVAQITREKRPNTMLRQALYLARAGKIAQAREQVTEAIEAGATGKQLDDTGHQIDQLVRQFGTGELSVFKAHCPMAFDDKGADWLQPDENLLNPYFGAEMLKCGEITEQIR